MTSHYVNVFLSNSLLKRALSRLPLMVETDVEYVQIFLSEEIPIDLAEINIHDAELQTTSLVN